ncbi:relaxase/mobilization nuclease domain-containing protein [Bacillus velezensis]|uniref:relaxase/mobilization nuclease domain-containing protein n=1 Tax=Bacillus velezensis TaxID=492670 RepID=UPI0009CE81BA|nr:relaxase/mobilization nuclease domain-containing protein [Bacillus velezensis]MEC2273088.1 relaxase/mobilization nuclease domain-containing protein [Bacillus velezensis]MED3680074.1 relaxase/mobilization nuclease domain-containing protein [Bacillus velezensis]SLC73099.1 Relaxase/Mobilisation nuclease domain [Mycobacteroides abscessus subsp. massiliense]
MVAHVKSLGFASHSKGGKPITHIKEHIKYIELDREHHRTPPELFTAAQDTIPRIEFFKKLNEQPKRGVVGHKLVLSLSEDEQGRFATDLKELVRDTMNRFEGKHNVKLDWIAAVHDDKGHPHAHIVIRGYNQDGKQVGLYPSHLKDLQTFAEQEKERQFERSKGKRKSRDFLRELTEEKEYEPALQPIEKKRSRNKEQKQQEEKQRPQRRRRDYEMER